MSPPHATTIFLNTITCTPYFNTVCFRLKIGLTKIAETNTSSVSPVYVVYDEVPSELTGSTEANSSVKYMFLTSIASSWELASGMYLLGKHTLLLLRSTLSSSKYHSIVFICS